MIIEKKEGLKEGRGSLLECIRSQNAVPGMEFFSLRNPEERKKVLILSSWKAGREAACCPKACRQYGQGKYDTVIYSGWLGSRGDVKEFLAFEKEIPKVMGAGRMTLSEEDFLNYRMIEKKSGSLSGKSGNTKIYANACQKRVGQAVRQQFLGCGDHGWKYRVSAILSGSRGTGENESSGGS